MTFLSAHLQVGAARMADQQALYETVLGLPTRVADGGFTVTVGETELTFTSAPGEPFYHFALLVPGDRFDAALAWIGARVTLLPHPGDPEVVFDFPDWDAQACYFHDPAGSIVELIAHRRREATAVSGPFAAGELIGLSELGLVGRPTAMAPPLTERLGLPVWDGRVADHDALAFLGEAARTLILVPAGRGWLPTGRPAELHPTEAVLSGERAAGVELENGLYRISCRP
jgi:hypothetical protein